MEKVEARRGSDERLPRRRGKRVARDSRSRRNKAHFTDGFENLQYRQYARWSPFFRELCDLFAAYNEKRLREACRRFALNTERRRASSVLAGNVLAGGCDPNHQRQRVFDLLTVSAAVPAAIGVHPLSTRRAVGGHPRLDQFSGRSHVRSDLGRDVRPLRAQGDGRALERRRRDLVGVDGLRRQRLATERRACADGDVRRLQQRRDGPGRIGRAGLDRSASRWAGWQPRR